MQQNPILEVLAQRIPPIPHQSCPFISTRFDISSSRLLSTTKEEEQEEITAFQKPIVLIHVCAKIF
jgi:hypothetical protein